MALQNTNTILKFCWHFCSYLLLVVPHLISFVMCEEEETLIENMRTAWSAERKETIGTTLELSPAVMETSRPSSTVSA